MMEPIHSQTLIVGAGLSGLMAANFLQKQGIEVTLADKGRSVGGRLATRRIGPGRADHGAQFFTVRHQDFEQWVYQWLKTGLTFRWSTGWSHGSTDMEGQPDGYPRFAIKGGMNALAKHLAQGLQVQVSARLTAVRRAQNGWLAEDEQGRQFTSQAIIMTPPVPQSLALLDAGQIALSAEDTTALTQIEYAPCIAGMFWVDGPVNLPEPGAIQQTNQPISWIADNQRKGISPEATLITVHAGPDYSRQLWDKPENDVSLALTDGLAPFLEPHTNILELQIKRWRYSLPTTQHPKRCLAAANLPPLVFAGDAFGEPRIEGAALSGLAAGAKLLSLLKRHSVYDETTR